MNPLLIAAIIGGGYFLLSGTKKKATASSKSTFTYECGSLTLHTTFKNFNKSLYPKIQKLFKDRKITKDNVLSLSDTQVIDLSKYWIAALNPSCAKDPTQMTDDEKLLYFVLFSSLFIKLIQLRQGASLQSEYIVDSTDLPEIRMEIMGYAEALQKYLGIKYTEEQIAIVVNKIAESRQYP